MRYALGNSKDFHCRKKLTSDLENHFKLSYKLSYKNGASTISINSSVKDDVTLKIPVNVFLNHITLSDPFTEQEGTALYYILMPYNTNPTTIWYFTYAITPATFNPGNGVTPILNGDTPYLVPTNGGVGYTKISEAEFLSHQNDYLNKIELRDLTNNSNLDIKNFQTIFTKPHPTNTFYNESEIFHFYSHNKSIAPIDDKFYLTINHGAIFIDNPYNNIKVQTPILAFEYDNIQMVNNNPIEIGSPYKNKAMDVGRLCPPDC